MIPSELVDFLQTGPSLQVGTRDAERMPECTQAVGHRVSPDRRVIRVLVPRATGARTVANARAFPRVALVASHPLTHRSVQLKGDAIAVAEAPEDDRAAVDAYLGAHGPVLGFVGVPLSVVKRVAVWPAWAIDVAVTDLFEQTPGPGAGERLGGGPR